MSFSGVEAYKKQRDVLIKEDRKLRREYSTPRSPLEIEADKMMRKLREKEAKTIWKEDTPDIPNRFAGMGFLTGIIDFSLRIFGFLKLLQPNH